MYVDVVTAGVEVFYLLISQGKSSISGLPDASVAVMIRGNGQTESYRTGSTSQRSVEVKTTSRVKV